MSQSERITVWQMDECYWWVGAGPASAMAAAFREEYGYQEDDEVEPVELSDLELEGLKYTDCDENAQPTGIVRTFREQLAIEIAEGGKFPRLFACTEY